MTAQRQERNGIRSGIGFRPGIALIGLLAGLAGPVGRSRRRPCPDHRAGDRQPVYRSGDRGLSIPSPISPMQGPSAARPDFEASESGAVWRFRNEGNRASFVAYPEIYGPQFGGYDPTDLARGVTDAGNPRLWADCRTTALFVRPRGNPRRLCRRSGWPVARGKARWPELEQGWRDRSGVHLRGDAKHREGPEP